MILQLKKIRVTQIAFYLVLLTIVALFVYIGHSTLRLSSSNYRILNQQTDILTNLFTDQLQKNIGASLYNADQKRLNQVTENLAHSELIDDATIYDKTGIVLANSAHATPLMEQVGIVTPLSVKSYGKQQLVTEIFYQHRLVGFLRLSLNRYLITTQTQEQIESNENKMRLLLIGCILLGFLLGLLVAKKNRL